MLQRADIFWARPTHLSPIPRKETRKSAIYELARTCTQERLWQPAKMIANADDIWLSVTWKENTNNSYFSWKVTQSRYRYYFYVEFLDGGKHVSCLIFWKHSAVDKFYGALIFLFKWGGQSFSLSAVWKSQSCYSRELVGQQARDIWL